MTDLDELRKLGNAADDDADALLAAWGPVIGGDCSYDRLDALNAAIVHAARSLVAMRNALPDLLNVAEAARAVPHHRPQPECCTCGLCELEEALAKLDPEEDPE